MDPIWDQRFLQTRRQFFGKAADEVYEEVRAHSPLANKIHVSFLKARAETGAWSNISDLGYMRQRNRILGL